MAAWTTAQEVTFLLHVEDVLFEHVSGLIDEADGGCENKIIVARKTIQNPTDAQKIRLIELRLCYLACLLESIGDDCTGWDQCYTDYCDSFDEEFGA